MTTNNTPTAALRAVMRDLDRLGDLRPATKARVDRLLAEESKNAQMRRSAERAQDRRLRRLLELPSFEVQA